jgi:hypothetical protein
MYYNTDQDATEFGAEYYYVSDSIMSNRLPYKLEYLSDEFRDILMEEYPFLRNYYKPFIEAEVYDDEGEENE